MPNLREIAQPKPLAKIAYERLRASILAGELGQDELHNEMVLAKQLGISRTPVREALLELSSQGLVTFLPRKGVVVNQFTRQDVEEVFELRWVIELYAIEKVANASASYNLSKIDKAIDDQRKAVKQKDIIGYLKANAIFHRTFSELTNNRRFLAIFENISDLIQLMGIQGSIEDRVQETIPDHEIILKAVKQGNPLKAKKAMEHHLHQFRKAVLEGFSSNYYGKY
jgi:DNA-binding GntR family transcriptional regulator